VRGNRAVLAAGSGAEALRLSLDATERARRVGASNPSTVIGGWRLDTDGAGNLVAVHGPSGYMTILAVVPSEEQREGGSDG